LSEKENTTLGAFKLNNASAVADTLDLKGHMLESKLPYF
jgi:hypothetical protein